jgi:hypothetical protein
MNQETIFGGNLSVRKEENEQTLLMFGHDEVIFKQSLLTKKGWNSVSTKRRGPSLISAFQYREFGFGYQLNEVQLVQVNIVRRGKKYQD